MSVCVVGGFLKSHIGAEAPRWFTNPHFSLKELVSKVQGRQAKQEAKKKRGRTQDPKHSSKTRLLETGGELFYLFLFNYNTS